MDDLRDLEPLHFDALREVANIGAGHAATALSQMIDRTIMISVPEVSVTPLEDVPGVIGDPEEVTAAVLMQMMGDLTGRTLLMFPSESADTLCDLLLRRSVGTTGAVGSQHGGGLCCRRAHHYVPDIWQRAGCSPLRRDRVPLQG